MKIVCDTNVLVSALIVKKGKPAQILRRLEDFDLLISEEILAEVDRVLHYRRIRKRYPITEEDINTYLQHLRKASTMIPLQGQLKVIQVDPDDDKFLECAVVGGAAYIVSGDAHLADLKEYQRISILSPAAFLELLTERSPGPDSLIPSL
jgi:putative PIN family toxin of toxin-antitoxin system